MSLSGKVNDMKMRTNDGEMVPRGPKGAVNAGFLNRDTVYSNEDAFERDRVGNAPVSGKIKGMQSQEPSVNLDDPGFDADGSWQVKNGTPYGEAAMFNQLPPGMDIDDQAYALINTMTLRKYTGGMSFPGDSPWGERDIPE